MILRTPTDQANLARAAHSSRTRRVAARCRVLCRDMKMRRDFNRLCEENDMAAPFNDVHFAVDAPRQKITKPERVGMMKALERLARSWL